MAIDHWVVRRIHHCLIHTNSVTASNDARFVNYRLYSTIFIDYYLSAVLCINVTTIVYSCKYIFLFPPEYKSMIDDLLNE